jgi:hypothetical protein
MTAIEGGCNCGAIRYRIDSEPFAVAVCHCENCRLQSGSAFSVNLIVKARTMTVEGTLAMYEDSRTDSGNPLRREFCATCGSPIRSIPTAQPALIAVKAGTADAPDRFAPTIHLWTSTALPWVEIPADLPSFPKNPAG